MRSLILGTAAASLLPLLEKELIGTGVKIIVDDGMPTDSAAIISGDVCEDMRRIRQMHDLQEMMRPRQALVIDRATDKMFPRKPSPEAQIRIDAAQAKRDRKAAARLKQFSAGAKL